MDRPITTDPQDEPFDVLLPDGTPAGYTKSRRQVHRDGDRHAALHIWVYGVAPGVTPFVLFQRRSRTKDTFPGAVDVAVGGHVRAGETLEATAREAHEELGLAIEFTALEPIGRRFVSSRDGDVRDNEVQQVFALRSDAPLESYQLHPEEVDALLALTLDDAYALFTGAVRTCAAIERSREGIWSDVSLSLGDFTPFSGGYGPAALTALRSLSQGEPVLPFEIHAT